MRHAIRALPVFYLGMIMSAGPSPADEKGEPKNAATIGKESYIQHCALCHGASGRGDGPIADALKAAPADLTKLAARHDAQFPSAKVADIIRNGGGVLGHGTLEMPAWGTKFGEKGHPEIARARIGGLIRYLESLQGK